jgi:SAM-dependent methyltransferase
MAETRRVDSERLINRKNHNVYPSTATRDTVRRRYREIADEFRLFRRSAAALVTVDELFGAVDCRGKDVVDVGGGNGALSVWAALNGARAVTCLEPEHAGATDGVFARARTLTDAARFPNLRVLPLTLQQYAVSTPQSADVIVCNATINHIDETACSNLGWSNDARAKYLMIAQAFVQILRPGGVLLLADCSRQNIWPALKLRSPFAKTIEWTKHQTPGVWRKLFVDSGLTYVRTTWRSQALLGEKWSWLCRNYIAAHLGASLFVIEFQNPRQSDNSAAR